MTASVVQAWLRLVRLPNLLTVPGDVLAGFFLAGGASAAFGRLGYAVGASVTLYIVGLVLNDVCDRDVDAVERPGRPIPSGAVPVRSALLVAGVAALSSLNLAVGAGGSWRSAPFAAAAALLAAVVLYDLPLRRRCPALGLALMGLCRALNVLLGAATALDPSAALPAAVPAVLHAAAPAAGAVFLYVLAFSVLARHETDADLRSGSFRFALPFFALVVGLLPGLVLIALPAMPSGPAPADPADPSTADVAASIGRLLPSLLSVFAAAIATLHAFLLWRVYPRYLDPPEIIGRHVQNLIRVQSALVIATGGYPALVAGMVLFLFAPLFARLARACPAS